MSAVITLCQKN